MKDGSVFSCLCWVGLALFAGGVLLVLRRLVIELGKPCSLTGKTGATMLIEDSSLLTTISDGMTGILSPSVNTARQTWKSLTKGAVRIAPMGFAVVSCLVIITVPMAIALAKYFDRYPIYELQNVHVDQKVTLDRPGWHYWMTYNSESVGHIRFLATICEKPQFEEGSTLQFARYEDRGSCWSFLNEHAGYLIVRDKNGNAIHTP